MRGKVAKLGQGCPKVSLSQDRLPIVTESWRKSAGIRDVNLPGPYRNTLRAVNDVFEISL